VGANVGETIGLDLSNSVRSSAIGGVAEAKSVALNTVLAEASGAVAGSYSTGDLSSLNFSTATAAATPEVYTATANAPTAYDFSVNTVSFDVSSDGGTTADTVTLDGTVGSGGDLSNEAGLLSEINTQLATSGVTATVDGGKLVFTADTGATANDIVVDSFTAGGTPVADFVTGSVTTPGADATVASSLVFDVYGQSVTLDQDYSTSGMSALVSDLQTKLDGLTGGAGVYTAAAVDADSFSITSATPGATPPTVVGNFQARSITGASGGSQVDAFAGVAAKTVTLGADELTFQIGDAKAVSVKADTYTSAETFVDSVNKALGGDANAVLGEDGKLTITSGEKITIAGASADGTVFSAGASEISGSLNSADVLTKDGANATIQRVDAALSSISDLRSTFGAVQNRFESTIANLSTSVENLSASNSRILDADFASETAALAKSQVLQQAGISVLAQANARPQQVLSLLQ
jgi:flagellin